jgi:hypothetical protein
MSKGRIVQGTERPRLFVWEHIVRGHIFISSKKQHTKHPLCQTDMKVGVFKTVYSIRCHKDTQTIISLTNEQKELYTLDLTNEYRAFS